MTAVSPARAVAPLVLALDVGTSSVRAELYDARGRRLPNPGAQHPTALLSTADGGAEIDADALIELTARVLDDGVAHAAGARAAVGAVAMSTFWHSVVGVGEDRRAVTPLYTWADSRSRGQMATLRERLDEREVHARTGCVLHWSYLPAKLLWLADRHPDRFRQVRTWMSFGEYFHLRVFGQTVCSLSMASGTGLLDQNARRWDPEMLRALPISPDQLAPLAEVDAELRGPTREYARRWPSLRDLPWYPAVGDGACSNVGSGCVTRERMALMVGTTGVVRVAWRAEQVRIPPGVWCYRVDGRRFVMGGALANGGNLFAWLRDTLAMGSLPAAERELAGMEPDAHGLTVLPFLAGERSPGYAADARGAILGLTLATRPIDVLRAGLEAVALRFALVHDILRDVVPEAREVVATGGALLRSPAWVQIVADALGRPIVASREPEASSRGAALLALEALGVLDLESAPLSLGRVYEPDEARHARYQAAQDRHRRYYRELIATGTEC